MMEGPDIARIAALIGDPARANMLSALMDGRALTASELAAHAGVTKQTASSHLARLLDGGLLAREVQGRHRYFRLGGSEVAHALEALMGVAERGGGRRTRTGPKDPALRRARVCYDHLAGDKGVELLDRLLALGWIERAGEGLAVSEAGHAAFGAFGVDMAPLLAGRRPLCRPCLDWSARRHHLAGALGRAILDRIFALGWARRTPGERVVTFSPTGERAFAAWLA